MDYPVQLQHWGIKGMKWGVRRTTNNVRGSRRSKLSLPDPRTMSDEDLRKKINRFQMENQYRTLSKLPTTLGKQRTSKALKYLGKTAVKAVAIATVYQGAKYLSAKYGFDETAVSRVMEVVKIIGNG